jgi:hypothetical protein
MAGADAFQTTAEENVSVHHYANVLFNVLRGGTFDDQYQVSSRDVRRTIKMFNRDVFARHEAALSALPNALHYSDLLSTIEQLGDRQLERLCREYLPITFGRRHGDPSRPWNEFAIKLKDDRGDKLLFYQGNWRDIFQNWEALTFSFPEFVENVIAKFLNATTADGYNPYRISKEGIDWEVEDPDDPWSHIGYWGDHQIIYLLKLLELSNRFHPQRLLGLLRQPIFSYANVPYRIKSFESLLENAKSTVVYDREAAQRIEQRVADKGADGKLMLDANGDVYQVNLVEKLLVPLLSKLGNLVLDGGIWLNTQRPEWNDANNALVGHGLSMVTLYYMRRYIDFLKRLLAQESGSVSMSREVTEWLGETAAALSEVRPQLGGRAVSAETRYRLLAKLGEAASRYRQTIYREETFSDMVQQPLAQVNELLDDALAAIDHSIGQNRREDGMYHAYNLLGLKSEAIEVEHLYGMLEGQVAALSSGAIAPTQAADVLETLFESNMYRDDVRTFMLYPDRPLPRFLEKNRIPAKQFESIPLLMQMVEQADDSIVLRDQDGCYRFNADLRNRGDLIERLDDLAQVHGDEVEHARQSLLGLYEQVFNHKAFTGRSGTMFGYEGLGSVYWHMVSKLLLVVQENFFVALTEGADETTRHRLGRLYYRVREGLGFNRTPEEFGAFPTDPYSNTPKHAGAQQPGMTGLVKEEVLTRFGELGVRISEGAVKFDVSLLRVREFLASPTTFRCLDVDGQWQELSVPESGLAFTWCQVPFVYRLDDSAEPAVTVTLSCFPTRSLLGRGAPFCDTVDVAAFRVEAEDDGIADIGRRNRAFLECIRLDSEPATLVLVGVVAVDRELVGALLGAALAGRDRTEALARVRCGIGAIAVGKGGPVRFESIAKHDPSVVAQGGRAHRIQGLEVLRVLRAGVDHDVVVEHPGWLEVRGRRIETDLQKLVLEARVDQELEGVGLPGIWKIRRVLLDEVGEVEVVGGIERLDERGGRAVTGLAAASCPARAARTRGATHASCTAADCRGAEGRVVVHVRGVFEVARDRREAKLQTLALEVRIAQVQ